MKKLMHSTVLLLTSLVLLMLISCSTKNNTPSREAINAINLKRGAVISCSPSGAQYGSVDFEMSCSGKEKDDFNLGIKLLHSFEYDEAEKVFAAIIDKAPECAMAYWGVAMSNFHPLWTPPSEDELMKGVKAIEIAQSITKKSKREAAYINAIAAFYMGWEKADHLSRCEKFEKAMELLYKEYPNDKEAAIFYALALNAAANPADKSFAKQKKAGAILNSLYPGEPNHPGIVHYIIHTYDSPELAAMALPAARRYASVAPSSAHALHMPSHIFTRLGLWDECISSNIASVTSAQCYAKDAGIKGHWDEELHALDYLVYAYLQKGDNDDAKKQLDYLKTIRDVSALNFKVAYAFASIPCRYVLENKLWGEAASLTIHYENFPWEKFPWQKAMIHFTRLMGAAHMGNITSAKAELASLNSIHQKLLEQKDTYKANQVQVQIKAAEAWINFKEGKNNEALLLMNLAADLEDKTEKHPVSPGELIPARELLGDMLLQMNKPGMALIAYEQNLLKHPNRFNGLYGAAMAAQRNNDLQKANTYYKLLAGISNSSDYKRPEFARARLFLKNGKS
ncbi:MAG TPA: hypothetical protein VLR49_00890 [Ferruginibacter sp.]|nr:hypothetical protein [Ferruginibacter sp.]